MKMYTPIRAGIFLLAVLFLLVLSSPASANYLIFHLDGVSSADFLSELNAGNLPNISRAFEDGHLIPHVLSLFPGGTEMIYPRLYRGESNAEGQNVAWKYYIRDTDKVRNSFQVWLDMFLRVPRRSRTHFIYGFPLLDHVGGVAMQNIPQLLEQYGVVEFFWFSTDSTGHMFGEEGHRQSLYRFDRYFGKFLDVADLTDTNIILYADHGMTFGELELIDVAGILREPIGDGVYLYSYPNIYLVDNETGQKLSIAKELVDETVIDFTFVRTDDATVQGFHKDGSITFRRNLEGYSYQYEGADIFDYYNQGYQGDYLNALEWLGLTKETSYPAVPANISQLLSNPNSGDVVIVLNSPQIERSLYTTDGHHMGLHSSDLLVPVFVKGPALEHLSETEHLWLHQLFTTYVSELEEYRHAPVRELNTFALNADGMDPPTPRVALELSPRYRWKISGEHSATEFRGWISFDLYSSFFTRLWLGAGFVADNSVSPFIRGQMALTYRSLSFKFTKTLERDDAHDELGLSFALNKHLSLQWTYPARIGVQISW